MRCRTAALVALLALVCTLSAGPARAQPPAIDEQIVVTGSVAPATLGAVGRSVTVITADDLRGLPIRSVTDALRLVPGLWVRERGPFGSQTDFSLRGAGFGQALVLVDGVRLNDVQSGHHNGDLPLTIDDIERIEVLGGAGASLYGADAVGGIIHIVTRQGRGTTPSARIAAGQHGLLQVDARTPLSASGVLRSLSGAFERADGFQPVRDFQHAQVRLAARLGGTSLTVAHLDKDFGAAGYYGPAPSREWTTQTLVAADGLWHMRPGRRLQHTAWYRTHGDRFVYDSSAEAAVPNTHRTHSAGGTLRWFERLTPDLHLSAGGEAAVDVLRSTALVDREEARASAFVELEAVTGRLRWYPGVRLDAYSTFGRAWSPSLALAWQVRPAVKVRAAAGRAFRVPSFTERYYVDPVHQARASLRPERGWTGEAGIDWYPGGRWTTSLTGFVRRELDVIDWVRPDLQARWETANIRRVSTRGLEAGVRGRVASAAVGGHYAWTDVETDRITGLSKYVLDHARHGLSADVSVPVGGRVSVSARVERRVPVSRPAYTLVDLRAQRPWGRVTVFAEAANLFDTRYLEVVGVPMPGRWVRGGLEIR
jgi:outer membrane cobalamin receptor